jgi:hypothetical protein
MSKATTSRRAGRGRLEAKRSLASRPSASGKPNPKPPAPAPDFNEPFQFRDCADIRGVRFHSGEPALDGIWLNLSVDFLVHGARDGRRWEIWPHEASVYLQRTAGNSRICLGTFRSPLSQSLSPPYDQNRSEPRDLSFRRSFTLLEIGAIEKWRDGQNLKAEINVGGFGRRDAFATWSYFGGSGPYAIARSEWADMLKAAGLQDQVHLVVSAGADDRLKEGVKYLRAAVELHGRANYAAAAQTCRKAIEEIGTAGFGQKVPQEVLQFIRHQDQRGYSLQERAAIVLMAATLLVHSGAHAGPDERNWHRADAELALAMTAALLQISPSRLAETETSTSSSKDQSAGG